MKTFGFLLLALIAVSIGTAQTGFVVDHTCTKFDSIPVAYLDAARASLRIGYANTSHGHQLIVGLYGMLGLPGFSCPMVVNGLHPGYFINYVWAFPASVAGDIAVNDLRYGDGGFTWATRYMLGLPGNDRNVVMWAWCWHLSDATAAQVTKYLAGMDSLEKEYPNIKFVYMTGCLAGTGVNGNLNQRNEQIRAFCRTNNKILYDFADIESYDPDGLTNYMVLNADAGCNYSGGNWATQWIAAHPTSQLTALATACDECDHSHKLNCLQKGAAAWWLFARLAGWAGMNASTPSVPIQISPVNNATSQSTNLTIRWRKVGGATQYHLQVGTDSSFNSNLLVNDSTITDTLRTASGLSSNQRYFWRVRSKNASGTSAFSPVWNCRTAGTGPGAPALLSPPQGAIEQKTSDLKLIWRSVAGVVSYTFQLATDSLFGSGILKNDSTRSDTTYALTGLTQGTRYFWRVACRTSGGSGPFSSPWSFTTLLPVPGMVTLLSPDDGAIVGSDSVRFNWTHPIPSAPRFWFGLTYDSARTRYVLYDASLTDTVKIVKSLAANTTYYWFVNGFTSSWTGPVSQVRKFTVSVSSVAETNGIPAAITLQQNYPNPFNPTTEINFGIPRESFVRLDVYSMLGQKVATVLEGVRPAGYHSVRFEGKDLTSGIYLYQLTAAGATLFRKMLLLK